MLPEPIASPGFLLLDVNPQLFDLPFKKWVRFIFFAMEITFAPLLERRHLVCIWFGDVTPPPPLWVWHDSGMAFSVPVMSIALALLMVAQAASAAHGSQQLASAPQEISLPRECGSKLVPILGDEAEIAAHSRFEVPLILHPYGTRITGDWGLPVKFWVDAAGRVTCYSVKNFFGGPGLNVRNIELLPARRQVIARMAAAGFEPFTRRGKPVPVVVTLEVPEEEAMPEALTPLPPGQFESVKIGLSRSGCYVYSCANYSVVVSGDGSVRFVGTRGQVLGEHGYRIPVDDVKALLASLDQKNLWSLRPEYVSAEWTNPIFVLDLEIGGQTHRIRDVAGKSVGMPASVTAFQDEVDRVARSAMWNPLSLEGIEQLRSEGFAFDSKAGSDLLGRVFFHGAGSQDVVQRLLALGVPATSSRTFPDGPGKTLEISALEDAVSAGQDRVVVDLLRRGALFRNGVLNHAVVDKAFASAIRVGQLATVQAIWNATDEDNRPSLSELEWHPADGKMRSVLLRLDHEDDEDDKTPWQGLEIVEWFSGMGVDLNVRASDGLNLLQIAAKANDARLVQYLLAKGFNPDVKGRDEQTPLEATTKETVALILMDAGADARKTKEGLREFRGYADAVGWTRVVARLDVRK